MDYQEKLRLAKEALNSSSYDKRTIEYIFPELKENEDDRIRKELFTAFSCGHDNSDIYGHGITYGQVKAWLEKQGEQKANEIHPIFRVGDYIKNKNTSDKVVIEQLNVESEVYYYTSYDGAAVNHSDFPFSKQDEWELIGQKIIKHKSAWSEEDEKHYQGCLHVMNIVLNAKPYPYYNDYLWLKSIKERIKGE